MQLSKLSVLNYRNYQEASISFCEKFNCFTGLNGSGKTNILDAIYFLSFCKSFLNPIDSQNIFFGEKYLMVQGEYLLNDQKEIINSSIKKNQKKTFKKNKKEYPRLADHIGLFPCVIISPKDGELIDGGSELRRKFVDGIISQCNRNYLEELLKYNKALLQRNTLLKSFADNRYFDQESLEIWDYQMCQSGQIIFEERNNFLAVFIPLFNDYYQLISAQNEQVNLTYISQLSDGNMEKLLAENIQKDRSACHSTIGVHKDDLQFMLNESVLKKAASQGQQKTFLLALKLAQYAYLYQIKGIKPLLLLDDIFDKLDEKRVYNLLNIINKEIFGQVFITDTDFERMNKNLKNVSATFLLFSVEQGKITSNQND
jgi:DNA replication and repair protein RecF